MLGEQCQGQGRWWRELKPAPQGQGGSCLQQGEATALKLFEARLYPKGSSDGMAGSMALQVLTPVKVCAIEEAICIVDQ